MSETREQVTVDDVKRKAPGTVTFLDVRKHADGEQIRGAVRYDQKKLLEATNLTLPLPRDGEIVVYCGSGNSCTAVAAKLREQGYRGAVALEGGFVAWKVADLPTEPVTQEQPIPEEPQAGIHLL